MGGRGAYALRRFGVTPHPQRVRFLGGRAPRERSAATSGGGGLSDAEIKSRLGANFSSAEVAKVLGAGSGDVVHISSYGSNGIEAQVVNRAAGYSASYKITKDGSTVTFVGSSLFASAGNNAAAGGAIRSLRKGLSYGSQNGLIDKVVVPQAIGSANSKSAQGSSLWARLGVSAPLSQVFGSGYQSRLPAGLKSAKSISDLMLTKAGRTWWEGNRTTFRGELDFRQKNSSGYKVAQKFLIRSK